MMSKTNATVLRQSIQLARCLRRLGIQPGDVMALSGRNHLDLDISFYAALLNGMPINGLDPLYKYHEIKSHLKLCSPRVVFCQRTSLNDYLRTITELELNTKVICYDDGDYSLNQFIAQYDDNNEDENFKPLEFDADKIYAWLMCTGGTSGVLKLAAIKHRSFMAKLMRLQKLAYKVDDDKSSENTIGLHLGAVQWISAYFSTLMFPLTRQTRVTTSAPLTPEHVIDIINKYKRRIRPGATVTEFYGQTENLGLCLLPNPLGPIGSCGRADDRLQYIKLVDPDTGIEITEPFVNGELWSKGVGFTEYYNNPEETAKAFTKDGWYRSGDILYKDQEGNYFFVDRIGMLIKCRLYHVIPAELEAVIREHPGVNDVSVTSIPHKEDGQHPVACVVRKQGSNVTAQEIKDLISSRLSESQQLRGGVVFMDKLPYTSAEKLARGKLREMVLTAKRE